MSSGSMMSSVGNSQIYEAGDQRTYPQGENAPERFEAGQKNAHSLLDSKDQRSLGNTLAAAEMAEKREEQDEQERAEAIHDPLKPATDHGNEPSRGAQVDAEIQQDEQEYLERKGKA